MNGITLQEKVTWFAAGLLLVVFGASARAQSPSPGWDPLPAWNQRATKQSIVEFVQKTTKTGGPDFVPVEERIATFDNDGTLWSEQPMYVQLAFVLGRVKELAPAHLE
jgi:hypothetical protein